MVWRVLGAQGDSYKVFGYYLHDEQIKVCENIIHLHVKKEDSLFTSEFYYNMHKYYENTILSNDYTIVYVDEVKTSLPCEERWKVREIRSFSEVHADNQCLSIPLQPLVALATRRAELVGRHE